MDKRKDCIVDSLVTTCMSVFIFTLYPRKPFSALQHSGMVVASYYQVDSNVSSDPDGTVLMWDLKFKKDTPDFIFNCYVSNITVNNLQYIVLCLSSLFCLLALFSFLL